MRDKDWWNAEKKDITTKVEVYSIQYRSKVSEHLYISDNMYFN